MRVRLLALFLVTVTAFGQPPRLLLTSQRLKRLERDRNRQTERWTNFERRVHTVSDSSERGFELALYFVVTQDQQAHQEAIAWAIAHPCERRQAALVVNWLRDVPAENLNQIVSANCPVTGTPLEQMRDVFFLAVAKGDDSPHVDAGQLAGIPKASDLYALAELVEGYRTTQFTDLRRENLRYYSTLPAGFLLSLQPRELAHPTWQQHIAALAVVGLDPNLESSQFLQGWALEEKYMLHDGPGVGYELLWADPYLPGIGYQNMEFWLYRAEGGGMLLARTDWQEDACWIKVAHSGTEQENCPGDWQTKPTTFGHLELIPIAKGCVKTEPAGRLQERMLHSVQPHTNVTYTAEGDQRTGQTDDAGLWLIPNDVSGNICEELKETTHARRH